MKCICGKFDNSVRIPAMPITDSDLMAITIPSANMAGTAVERARHQDAASRLEAARQNERLRSILLDALAHDFTTPLTSIKGAITAVRSAYQHEAEEDDLLEVVEEESDKLTGMIDETVAMARIEPGRASIQHRQLGIMNLVRSSVDRLKSLLDGRPLDIQIHDGISPVTADPDMIGLAR